MSENYNMGMISRFLLRGLVFGAGDGSDTSPNGFGSLDPPAGRWLDDSRSCKAGKCINLGVSGTKPHGGCPSRVLRENHGLEMYKPSEDG